MAELPSPAWLVAIAGITFAIAAALTPLVGKVACHFQIVALPRDDRWHSSPVPLLGGVSIYASIVLTVLAIVGSDQEVGAVLAGTTIVFALGFLDDVRPINPSIKLAVQVVAASLLMTFGLHLQVVDYPIVWIPLTLIWIVGITNAFNLLDNIDGLAAGIGVITGLVLSTYGLLTGNELLLALSLLTAAASLGFLVRNFSPARIFMGDSGSLTLGFLLGGLSLMMTTTAASGEFLLLIVLVAVMAVPIFETTLVSALRLLHGRPITQGGRDHSSHRLVALGLSERQVVATLYTLSVVGGSLALASTFLESWAVVLLATLILLSNIAFGRVLSKVQIYPPDASLSDPKHNPEVS